RGRSARAGAGTRDGGTAARPARAYPRRCVDRYVLAARPHRKQRLQQRVGRGVMHLLLLTQNDIAAPRYGGALRVSALASQLCAAGHSVSAIRFRTASEAPSTQGAPFPIHDLVMPSGCDVASVAAISHLLGRAAARTAQM